MIDSGFEYLLGQTKDYTIGIHSSKEWGQRLVGSESG
jgi:hypothetical protein